MTILSRIALMAVMAAVLLAPATLADDPVLPDDAILGIWETAHEGGNWSHVEVYEEGGKVRGHIVWLKNPLYDVGEVIGMDGRPRMDRENSDEALRDRPILGLELMYDFVHNGKNKWEDGRIYDPKNGKTYRCKLTMKDDDTLEVFGYVKVGFVKMGRDQIWTRVKDSPVQQGN